jgi:hypothetical protein
MFRKDNLMIGERNMILGLNVPGYPKQDSAAMESGKNIEEDVFSFTPTHAWGPDKGTKTCLFVNMDGTRVFCISQATNLIGMKLKHG